MDIVQTEIARASNTTGAIHFIEISLPQLLEQIRNFTALFGIAPVITITGRLPYISRDGYLSARPDNAAYVPRIGEHSLVVCATTDGRADERLCVFEGVTRVTLRTPELGEGWKSVIVSEPLNYRTIY